MIKVAILLAMTAVYEVRIACTPSRAKRFRLRCELCRKLDR